MTQERQDGWYWVKWNEGGKWRVARWHNDSREWAAVGLHNNLSEDIAVTVGPRIPSPDEPKDPDLLAVARAAKEWREARKLQGDIGTSWTRLADAEQALRSALALLEERGL